MPSFNEKRLNIFEKYIDNVAENTDTSHGDDVFPSFRETVGVDDGYREADYVIEITIDNTRETRLVLMSSKVEDDERVAVEDIEDEEALKRARRYSAEIENGSYYGITDGNKVKVKSLDPDTDLELEREIDSLFEILNQIIAEERRIKDSNEFVDELGEHHEEIEPHTKTVLKEKIESDEDFEESIRNFLVPIGESYDEEEEIPDETLDMLAKQGTYLLIDKVLFYYLIRENEEKLKESLESEKYDEVFDQLKEDPPQPEEVDEEWAKEFWSYLQKIFGLIQEIDYEPIFDPENSPLNDISFESSPYACLQLKELMDSLYKKEELSHLFDGPLLSKIYEGLIPPEIRWKWGQIYTPPEVTRLITDWAVTNPKDNVLDPACGTGRFLVSSYERLADLKDVKIGEKHQEIIDQIYGIDINQFPAHLATMSLVAMDLGSITEKVNIDVQDFFYFRRNSQTSFQPESTKISMSGQSEFNSDGNLEGQGKLRFDKPIGKLDAIVMNPPYTRNEALDSDYKSTVRDIALSDEETGEEFDIGSNAAFYTYFITHSTKFLKNEGKFGMIIQNSVFDAEYGKDIERFLHENYRIDAIISTKRDRMIETADVNTLILLLTKEDDEEERKNNDVSFVTLNKSIKWFERNYGFSNIEEMISKDKEVRNEDFKVQTFKQRELVEQETSLGEIIEYKWNIISRTNSETQNLLMSNGQRFDKLGSIGEVEYGLKPGAVYFYLLPRPDSSNRYFKTEYLGEGRLEVYNKETEEAYELDHKKWMKEIEEERSNDYEIKIEINDSVYVPNYILKSAREIETRDISLDFPGFVLVTSDTPKPKLENEGFRKHIEWGESKGYHKRSSINSREPWYNIGDYTPGAFVLQQFFNKRIFHPSNIHKISLTNTFQQLTTEESNIDLLSGYMNSTLGIFMTELMGRTNLGEGALTLYGPDFELIPVLNLDKMENLRDNIELKTRNLMEGEIKSVFEILGAEKPEEFSISEVDPKVRELDEIFMEEIMDLDRREQLNIYRTTIDLIQSRMEKANMGE